MLIGGYKKNGNPKGKALRRVIALMLTVAMMVCCMPAAVSFAETEGAGSGSDSKISEMVSKMSIRQKITQCIMIDFRTWDDGTGKAYDMTKLDPDVAELLSKYQFGSLILFQQNIKNTEDTVNLVKDMQAATMKDGGLPMIVSTDQEGGVVYRLGSGTGLPGNMAVAATGDPDNAETSGWIIGRELDAAGINTTLAPVIDVNSNAGNPIIGVRSFGDDADTVGEYGSRFISGLNKSDIIGCAKHFPGHGDTGKDSHYGLPMVDKSLDELKQCELKPFEIAINQGVEMIMTAHILYPQIDNTKILSKKTGKEESRAATLSSVIFKDLLRGEMGYKGVIVTDSMVMAGISDFFDADQATLEALKAGADIVTMPISQNRIGEKAPYNKKTWTEDMEKILTTVEEAVKNGELSEASLDESVTRILELKQRKGILGYDPSEYTPEKAASVIGCKEHRELEREMAAKAVTVVRNNNNILPIRLNDNSKVLMLAPYNNERAQMVMGLNRAKEAGLVSDTVRTRFYRFSSADHEVQGELKNAIDWADIVIMSSELYNLNDMAYAGWASAGPKNFTEYCRANGKKSVVMSVNFPYDTQLYPAADAVVAVYGWKGSGVDLTSADVIQKLLYGEITGDKDAFGPNITAGTEVIFGVYGASGKLPVNVPAFDAESRTYTDKIVYKRGHGLTYNKLSPIPVLKKAEIRSLKAGKGRLTVKMTTAPSVKGGTYYRVAYKVKGSSTWKYKITKSSGAVIKGLKRGRKYNVKAQAYTKANGKKYYGAWSKTKTSGKIK